MTSHRYNVIDTFDTYSSHNNLFTNITLVGVVHDENNCKLHLKSFQSSFNPSSHCLRHQGDSRRKHLTRTHDIGRCTTTSSRRSRRKVGETNWKHSPFSRDVAKSSSSSSTTSSSRYHEHTSSMHPRHRYRCHCHHYHHHHRRQRCYRDVAEKREARKNMDRVKNQLKMEDLMSSALKVWKRDLLPYWDDV